jgi:hypothetical protein
MIRHKQLKWLLETYGLSYTENSDADRKHHQRFWLGLILNRGGPNRPDRKYAGEDSNLLPPR